MHGGYLMLYTMTNFKILNRKIKLIIINPTKNGLNTYALTVHTPLLILVELFLLNNEF